MNKRKVGVRQYIASDDSSSETSEQSEPIDNIPGIKILQ